MKKAIKILLIIILGFILLFAGFFTFLMLGQKEIKSLVINNINLNNINDGTYEGTYENGRWSNTVKVTISNHQITNIDFTKPLMIDKPELRESIINSVKEKQSLNIDTISGSTISTKAYLKAIENALK